MKIDGLLMKNYHLKPWELEQLTYTECSLMLLSLREDGGDGIRMKEDDDPVAAEMKRVRLQKMLDENRAYATLTASEKLEDAIRTYRR